MKSILESFDVKSTIDHFFLDSRMESFTQYDTNDLCSIPFLFFYFS